MIFDPKPRFWIKKPGKSGNAPIDFRGFKAKPPSNCTCTFAEFRGIRPKTGQKVARTQKIVMAGGEN